MKIIRKTLIVLYFIGAVGLFFTPIILMLSPDVRSDNLDIYGVTASFWTVGLFLFLNATLLRGNANDDNSLIGLAIEARKAELRRRIRERNASNMSSAPNDAPSG